MDIRKIKKLIELIEESDLSELEIKEGEESIRLSRASAAQGSSVVAIQPPTNPVPALAPNLSESQMTTADPLEEGLPDGNAVKSPMVGTFYSSPSPGVSAFAEVGQAINAGDVICIVEAMKIFNQIKTEFSGTVRAVTKQDGDPVEYGEVLYIIE